MVAALASWTLALASFVQLVTGHANAAPPLAPSPPPLDPDLVAVAPPEATDDLPTIEERAINGHPVNLDANGSLLSWITKDSPYDEVVRTAWDAFLTRFPTLENGEKTYVTYSRFDPESLEGIPWPHNPASLYAMLADSALLYYGYSGDARVLVSVSSLLDYQMSHGTTPDGWRWAHVPYASSTAGENEYGGGDDDWCDGCGRGDGIGVLEPDKVGELGLAYVRFHEATGEPRYLEEAIACANALAANVEPGDKDHSPWPFRVEAERGRAHDPYSANVLGAIELFDELLRIGEGEGDKYAVARDLAWRWLMTYPIENDAWAGYFEDIAPADEPGDNPNQYIASRLAEYLLKHSTDRASMDLVNHLVSWIRTNFAVDTETERGNQWGAEVLSEQRADMAKMGSHTARYAALMALYFERTGSTDAAKRAFRSFNWATYMVSEEGIVAVGEDKREGYWFSDGYGDYIRHFLKGMASYPAWAPQHENHLLRTSSVVRHIEYDDDQVRYETYDDVAEERFTLAREPTEITVGGVPLLEAGGSMRIYHLDAGAFVLDLARSTPGEVTISM